MRRDQVSRCHKFLFFLICIFLLIEKSLALLSVSNSEEHPEGFVDSSIGRKKFISDKDEVGDDAGRITAVKMTSKNGSGEEVEGCFGEKTAPNEGITNEVILPISPTPLFSDDSESRNKDHVRSKNASLAVCRCRCLCQMMMIFLLF